MKFLHQVGNMSQFRILFSDKKKKSGLNFKNDFTKSKESK